MLEHVTVSSYLSNNVFGNNTRIQKIEQQKKNK